MPKRSYRKKSGKGKKGSHKGSKRTYRKKGSRKGSKKSYRKKGSRKGSKKSYRKASSKKGKRIVRRTRRKSPCSGLDEAKCGYNPNCEYKTNKKGTKYCKSRAGTLYKRKLSNKLTKVEGPMGPPAGYKAEVKAVVKEEKKDLDKAEVVLDKKEEKLEAAIVAGAPAPVIAELKEEVKEAKEVVEEKLENLEKKVEEAKDLLGVGVFGDFSEPVEGVFGNIFPEFQRIRRRIKGSKRKSRGRKGSKKTRKHSKRHSKRKHSKRKGSKRY